MPTARRACGHLVPTCERSSAKNHSGEEASPRNNPEARSQGLAWAQEGDTGWASAPATS